MATRISQSQAQPLGKANVFDGICVTERDLSAQGLRFAVVVSEFNAAITTRLLEGALHAFLQAGARAHDIHVFQVPGAWELPLAATQAAACKRGRRPRFDAVLALGAVIRGDTPHFEYVSRECARGLMQTALQSGVPVAFGVLTTDDWQQAEERAGGSLGNKGSETALAAVAMANLYRKLRRG